MATFGLFGWLDAPPDCDALRLLRIVFVHSFVGGLAGSAASVVLNLWHRRRGDRLSAGFVGLEAFALALGSFAGALLSVVVSLYVITDRPWFDPWALAASLAVFPLVPIAVIAFFRLPGLRARGREGEDPVGPRWVMRALPALAFCFLVGAPATLAVLESRDSAWSGRPDPQDQGRPNVIIFVADAVRRDHVSLYGYHRPTTPVFDRLAREGVAFDDMHAVSSWSLPSVVGMLASRRAGAGVVPGMLGADLTGETLPDALHDLGYSTLAVSNNPHVTGPYGVGNRFDQVRTGVPSWVVALDGTQLGNVRGRLFAAPDEVLVDELIEAVHEMPKPFFAYVHIMAAHSPYELPNGYESPFEVHPVDLPITGPHHEMELSEDQRANLIDRYDALIRYADGQVGRLLSVLDEEGVGDDTLLIYTSDHGEEFGEHGRWTHGKHLNYETVDVPLVCWWPNGDLQVDTLRDDLSSHADLAPTIVSLVAADPAVPSVWIGRDLALRSGRPAERREYAFAEKSPGWRALISERHKLIINDEQERVWLYDRVADPREEQDLSEQHPEVVSRLRAKLEEMLANTDAALVPDTASEVDPALEEQLRSLGYLE